MAIADYVWKSEYEVGHPRIDFEHRIFLDLINDVARRAAHQATRDGISRLLREVEKYAEFHFYSEENIMEDSGYAGVEAHRKEHRDLLNQLNNHIWLLQSEEIDLHQVLTFLHDWFINHTLHSDRLVADHIKQPGTTHLGGAVL